jgi:hypothetical protein
MNVLRRYLNVIASEAKQSIPRMPRYGLLRFARNDDVSRVG